MFDEDEWEPTNYLRWRWWRLEQMWKRPVTDRFGHISHFDTEWRRVARLRPAG